MRDPRLEHRLLVLGVVVLGVLGDVAELACLLDPLSDLAALLGGEEIELRLELLESLWGEDDVLRHVTSLAGRQQAAAQYSGPRQAGCAARAPRRHGARGPRAKESAPTAPRRARARWRAAARAARRTRGRSGAGSARRARRRGARSRRRSPSRARRAPRRRSGGPSRSPSTSSNSHGLPSAPRASITAAAPVCLERLVHAPARCRGRRSGSPARRACARARRRARSRARPRWADEAARGCTAIAATPASRHEPARERDAVAVAGAAARAQLDGHRQAAALAGGARHRDGAIAVAEQRRAGAGAADLRHRAAHVEVDQVGARAPRRSPPPSASRRGRRRTAGSRPGRRALARIDPQQLAAGLLVAVVDGRSSRPSPRRRGRRRSGAPAGARTSCRSPRAARARRGWAARGRPERPAIGAGVRHQRSVVAQRLSSQISRRPSSVSRSSATSIDAVKAGTRWCASPPVAITGASPPSSSRSRRDDPVDLAGEAVDDPRADRVGGRLADQRRAARRARPARAWRRAARAPRARSRCPAR